MSKTKTIVLIHGNFVNNLTWNAWKSFYEEKGYTVHTPANPGHEGNPTALRTEVSPYLIETGFVEVVENLVKLIDGLPEKPLIIGHSMAGMAVMKLIELDKAVAGVSIDGAPPKNVFPPFQTIKTVLGAFGFFSFKKYFMGSESWYNAAFFNTLPPAERKKNFLKFAVPESFKVSRQLLLNSFSAIDFKKAHAPLLFVGGGKDTIFPAELTRKIANSYTHENSSVDTKIFPDKSHFICGEPGWEKVAEYIVDWYEKLP
ncbi:alpha/beta hydrolase [Pedobacter sp. MW01-1-1]|uniref:alpha/beta hydrolase n=1 Tax=Pedobacter sp. MW01-1-1 TaxID=3383027 RepID=UPI003FEDC212